MKISDNLKLEKMKFIKGFKQIKLMNEETDRFFLISAVNDLNNKEDFTMKCIYAILHGEEDMIRLMSTFRMCDTNIIYGSLCDILTRLYDNNRKMINTMFYVMKMQPRHCDILALMNTHNLNIAVYLYKNYDLSRDTVVTIFSSVSSDLKKIMYEHDKNFFTDLFILSSRTPRFPEEIVKDIVISNVFECIMRMNKYDIVPFGNHISMHNTSICNALKIVFI